MQVLSRSAVAFACAQESLRLDPALKISYRYATQDTTMGDLVIPDGTRIAMALMAVRTLHVTMHMFAPSPVSNLPLLFEPIVSKYGVTECTAEVAAELGRDNGCFVS